MFTITSKPKTQAIIATATKKVVKCPLLSVGVDGTVSDELGECDANSGSSTVALEMSKGVMTG